MIRPMTDEERQRAKERAMANKKRSSAATDWQSQSDEEARMPDDLVEMARLAQHDERMATGALYGDLADRIEELSNCVAVLEAKLKTSEEIGRAFEEDAGQLRAKLSQQDDLIKERSDEVQAVVAAKLKEAADLSALGFHPRDILALITEDAQAALDRAVAAALREAAADVSAVSMDGDYLAERILARRPDAIAALDRYVAKAVKPYRIALADAIRRPMGVVPASSEGLVTTAELDAAEQRRAAIRKGGE